MISLAVLGKEFVIILESVQLTTMEWKKLLSQNTQSKLKLSLVQKKSIATSDLMEDQCPQTNKIYYAHVEVYEFML